MLQSEIGPALARNAARSGAARLPDAGVKGIHARLELPTLAEGFDQLFYVRIIESGFEIEEWSAESPVDHSSGAGQIRE